MFTVGELLIGKLLRLPYFGGRNSLESQPLAVFIGSTGIGRCSLRTPSHFGHSYCQSSDCGPSGDIRARTIRIPQCLQIGRSKELENSMATPKGARGVMLRPGGCPLAAINVTSSSLSVCSLADSVGATFFKSGR